MVGDLGCFVCRKHRGEEPVPGGHIYKDDLVYASHAAPMPEAGIYLGYCFVDLKRHAPGLANLTDQEAEAIGRLVASLSRALEAELNAEKVYALVLGDGVEHLHIHVVPRHPGAPEEYWGMHVDEWPDAPRGNQTQIAELVGRLRAHLQAEINL